VSYLDNLGLSTSCKTNLVFIWSLLERRTTLDAHSRRPFSRTTPVSWYPNASILDFIGARMIALELELEDMQTPGRHQQTYQHSSFYQRDALPVAMPTVSEH